MCLRKKSFVLITLSLFVIPATQAQDIQNSTGLYELLSGESKLLFSEKGNVALGGWISAGANYNPDSRNGSGNSPVSFNYRANEFNLEQFNLFIERSVSSEIQQWQIGGRFDFM